MDMKKCSTPNPASMAKRQNTGGLQSSSGMDVSGITDEPDFAGFSDMVRTVKTNLFVLNSDLLCG